MSQNVSRREGSFWREQSRKFRAKSRGDFQKYCMALGLSALNKKAAKQLAKIRDEFGGKRFVFNAAASVIMLGIFIGGQMVGRHTDLRAHRAARVRQEFTEVGL